MPKTIVGDPAMSETKELPEQKAKALSDELVRERFPERITFKRRVAPLWSQNGRDYYRVNYMNWDDWTKMETYWVVVYNGIVTVEKD